MKMLISVPDHRPEIQESLQRRSDSHACVDEAAFVESAPGLTEDGFLIGLLFVKRSRAIPFGPWLSLGVLVMIFARDRIVEFVAPGLTGLGLIVMSLVTG